MLKNQAQTTNDLLQLSVLARKSFLRAHVSSSRLGSVCLWFALFREEEAGFCASLWSCGKRGSKELRETQHSTSVGLSLHLRALDKASPADPPTAMLKRVPDSKFGARHGGSAPPHYGSEQSNVGTSN